MTEKLLALVPGKKQAMLAVIIGVALWLVLRGQLAADVWFFTSGGLVSGGGFLADLATRRVDKA